MVLRIGLGKARGSPIGWFGCRWAATRRNFYPTRAIAWDPVFQLALPFQALRRHRPLIWAWQISNPPFHEGSTGPLGLGQFDQANIGGGDPLALTRQLPNDLRQIADADPLTRAIIG